MISSGMFTAPPSMARGRWYLTFTVYLVRSAYHAEALVLVLNDLGPRIQSKSRIDWPHMAANLKQWEVERVFRVTYMVVIQRYTSRQFMAWYLQTASCNKSIYHKWYVPRVIFFPALNWDSASWSSLSITLMAVNLRFRWIFTPELLRIAATIIERSCSTL